MRRHGRRRRKEKVGPTGTLYHVTVCNGRAPRPIQNVLDPVFDAESDGDLRKGQFFRRYSDLRIDNIQVAGGSTYYDLMAVMPGRMSERNGARRSPRESASKTGA